MEYKMDIIHLSFCNIFRLGGVTFEWHDYLGPTILSRNTERVRKCENISLRNWVAISKFMALNESEREAYRVF